MERVSERERILLGYVPCEPFGGAVATSQHRNSDVDFLDVFGGPPRRSSVYESRRTPGDSMDSYSRQSRGREDSTGSNRSRLGSGEKPVFGDGGCSSRRQQLGDNFYDDIFQSSESSCSSPRRADRNPLISSSSSRVSSPNRPAPPLLEPSCGGSFLPMQPSISETITKGLDHPSFGSSTKLSVYKNEDIGSDAFSYPLSPKDLSSGFVTTQSVVGYGDSKNNGYGSYSQSPLSRPILHGLEGFSEATEPALQTAESQDGKSSRSLEDYINNRQFHFSIYKWAAKGVMLVMPSDSIEGNELEGFTRLPEVIVQELELPTHCDSFSPVIKSLNYGTVIQENKTGKKADDYAGITANISHAKSILEVLKDNYGNSSEKDSVPGIDKKSTANNTNENVNDLQTAELKSSSQLFDDGTKNPRSHIFRQVKQQPQRKSKLVHDDDNSTTVHDIPSSEDKPRGNKVKGKVKEFIKKFNQEAPPKRKGLSEMLNQRSKIEDSTQNKADELANVSSIEPDKLQEGGGSKSIPLCDISKENPLIEKAEEMKSSIYYDRHTFDDRPSVERVEPLHSQSEPTPENLNNAACYEDIFHEDVEEYSVQQLPINLTEGAVSQQDQIKDLDANIRQWAKGKEGNIRSLLSTLQLVLWPESGWKQVPLVNIIESPSVKKAYQKALLCLHPDKLQQKGASWDQKYIAEKVFDILQEAWDHFNSVSQF